MSTFRFATLGSGSRGNCTLIESDQTRLLVDCGFSTRELEKRAKKLSVDLATIDGILVTHEHSDHIGGVARFARKYGVKIYLTRGTRSAVGDWDHCALVPISPHAAIKIGNIDIQPFPVPHDAREPCQFSFHVGGKKLGMISDLGHVTPHVAENLDGCDAMLLECNHDPEMLAKGPYPYPLKQRVAGDWGHLSNLQSAELLARVSRDSLQKLVLTHLSEQNNTPALARAAICDVLQDDPSWCICADQNAPSDWSEVA